MSEAKGHPGNGHASLKAKAIEEFKLFWLIVAYLVLLFGTFMIYRRLVLAEFGVTYLNYGFALIQALVIGKLILIGDAMQLGKRLDQAPLIVAVIYKSIVFSVFVMAFGVLEHLVEGLYHKEHGGEILKSIVGLGWDELLARTIMLIAAFIPFFTFWEIGRELGRDKLFALFFARRTARPAVDRDR